MSAKMSLTARRAGLTLSRIVTFDPVSRTTSISLASVPVSLITEASRSSWENTIT